MADSFERLLEEVKRLHEPLNTLALVALSQRLYPAEKWQELDRQHRELLEADNKAFEIMQSAMPPDKMSYEERVARYGEDEARRAFEPYREALEVRRATSEAVNEFEKSNPVFAAITRSVSQLTKRWP